MDLPYIKPR